MLVRNLHLDQIKPFHGSLAINPCKEPNLGRKSSLAGLECPASRRTELVKLRLGGHLLRRQPSIGLQRRERGANVRERTVQGNGSVSSLKHRRYQAAWVQPEQCGIASQSHPCCTAVRNDHLSG